jgi:hypothetical protein
MRPIRNWRYRSKLFVSPMIADAITIRFKLRAKELLELLRLRRKSRPNLWQFGLAVHEVIAARTSLAMTGKLSAAEVRRMVVEKRLAVMRAHFACTEAILSGQGASAPSAYFAVYERTVDWNRKRLSNRGWRWPGLQS